MESLLTHPNNNRSLQSISIKTQPTKKAYTVGQDFDKTGLKVNANYDNGDVEELLDDAYTIPDGTNLQEDDTFVTVSYQGQTVRIEGITVTP